MRLAVAFIFTYSRGILAKLGLKFKRDTAESLVWKTVASKIKETKTQWIKECDDPQSSRFTTDKALFQGLTVWSGLYKQ